MENLKLGDMMLLVVLEKDHSMLQVRHWKCLHLILELFLV